MAALPPHATFAQRFAHAGLRVFTAVVLFFLVAPVLVIIPLSFNAGHYFTFTPEMLRLDPAGFSLRHYEDFFTDPNWQAAVRNSARVAPAATLLSMLLGTVAAVGLTHPLMVARRLVTAILLSPMIVPLIISAAGMYFFYSRIGLQGSYLGVVLAHTALGTPFVIITVTATLAGFNRNLTRAAAGLGAPPLTVFRRVLLPLILPGVVSGGLFAFITSLDEVVVVLFVGSAAQKTLPWVMFTGLREEISPTILAVATLLVALSVVLLVTVELLRRRAARLQGGVPA